MGSEGPSELTGRTHAVLEDLAQCKGSAYMAELAAIVLARSRLIALHDLARGTGASIAGLPDEAEVQALEGFDYGPQPAHQGRVTGGACPAGRSRTGTRRHENTRGQNPARPSAV